MEKALSPALVPTDCHLHCFQPSARQDLRSGRPSFLLGVLQLTQDLSMLPPSAQEVIKIVEHPSDSGITPSPASLPAQGRRRLRLWA
ncbi:hypothetical protein CapIbe_013846 [Capra ibex]